MLFATVGQIYVFLWMVGAGAAIGALWALMGALRRLFAAGLWLSLFLDALAGLGTALILIAAMLLGNYGAVRLYELLGAAVGAALFTLGVAPPLRACLCAVGRRFRRLARRMANFRLIKVIFR